MNNTIKTAQDYETIKRMLKTFHRDFLTLKHFMTAIILAILSAVFFMFIHDDPDSSTLGRILTGLSALFFASAFTAFSIIAIAQNFTNEKICTLTYPKHYQNHFSDEEKHLLENILDDSFENIIHQNKKDTISKLNYIKHSIEEKIFTMEYLESFKKSIEEDLEKRKQYIPLLKSFAQKYHARDRDNAMLESANQQLSKIGLSTFRTKSKPIFEIIEESA